MFNTNFLPDRQVPTNDKAQHRRALRKLLRDLIAFTGTVATTPRKTPQRKQQQRLLYRRADTLTNDEVGRIVREIGPERVLHVLDDLTQPQLPLMAAE